jgi:hypothetical protein
VPFDVAEVFHAGDAPDAVAVAVDRFVGAHPSIAGVRIADVEAGVE